MVRSIHKLPNRSGCGSEIVDGMVVLLGLVPAFLIRRFEIGKAGGTTH